MTIPETAPEPEFAPDLSVVVVCPEGGAGIRRLVDRLAAQSIAPTIELLVAVPAGADAEAPPPAAERLGAARIVPADLSTSARARVPAIRAARAPFVVLAEDHCFPLRDDWAERMLQGLRAGHAAVGPMVRNANPATATSWAVLVSEYSPWFHADAPAEVDLVPGHNSGYDRAALLGYGDRLGDMLEAEFVLHRDLRAKGRTLLFDPRIEVEHLNYSYPLRALHLAHLCGWMFAASRAHGWGAPRRAAYAAAAPLIAARRFPRVLRQAWRAKAHRRDVARSAPLLALVLTASALGEGLGYALGAAGRRSRLAALEYHRWRNMTPGERALAR